MASPTTDLDVTLAEIEGARERIGRLVQPTPMLHSTTAATWTTAALGVRLADDRLYLKAEHLQTTGSFKARGMSNKIASLPADARARGAITLSAGNAGAAYAWAGRAAGVPVTVVMPAGAVRSKVDACRGYGARVVLHGTHVGEALLEMERIRDEEGLTYCHPFDDPAVIAGNGTAGLDLVDDLPDVDVVIVGVGGGGLISGVAAAPAGSTSCLHRSRTNRIPARIVASSMSTIPSRYRRAIARVQVPANGAPRPSATLTGLIVTTSPRSSASVSAFDVSGSTP